MKVINDVLSDSLLSKCNKELNNKLNKDTWISSWFAWPPDVRSGVSGNCLITSLSPELEKDVENEVLKYFPVPSLPGMLFQVFQPYSGLSPHADADYGFSATLYLNDFWDSEWGGWFIWADKDTEQSGVYKSFLPKRNTMMLSTESEKHLVTPISPFCGQFRCTIQIRGSNPTNPK